jgi:hypothetical protein
VAQTLTVDDFGAPADTLKAQGPTGSIIIRLASLPNGWLLLMEREGLQLDVHTLQSLSITKREAEILAYVANGKTNPEIAIILGVSRLTVKPVPRCSWSAPNAEQGSDPDQAGQDSRDRSVPLQESNESSACVPAGSMSGNSKSA